MNSRCRLKSFTQLFTAQSDEALAINELSRQMGASADFFPLLFFSNQYNKSKIETELVNNFSNEAVAVSTAGEIANGSYHQGTISGLAFNKKYFDVSTFLIEDVSNIQNEALQFISTKVDQLRLNNIVLGSLKRSVCLVLVDGVSKKEELLMEVLGDLVKDIPIIGGSSGDGLNFNETTIFYKGKNRKNSAVLVFLSSEIPFEIIKSQHFEITNKKLVITEAIPEERKVLEINGIPAAEAYAEILEINKSQLNTKTFSEYPLALNIAGNCFVRSIRSANEDGSLTFYCAIENGIVLSLAERKNFLETTRTHFETLKNNLGDVEFCILFECVLRRLEVADLPTDKRDGVFKLYDEYKGTGFHTYGEQIGSLHINQTITGVMFGKIGRR